MHSVRIPCSSSFGSVQCFKELPSYARPKFLRILSDMEITGTFKHQKAFASFFARSFRRSNWLLLPFFVPSNSDVRWVDGFNASSTLIEVEPS